MAARVMRRMSLTKASILVFILVALLTTAFMIKMSQGEALPTNDQDSTAVPHYFGPWTNWALSPLTVPDAVVTISGDGTGAAATATVGANGAVTGITVTNPGNGYAAGTTTVAIGGSGTLATATATVTASDGVVAVAVDPQGSGYSSPTAAVSGGGATTAATLTAYGSVDAIALTGGGTGYQFPTVDFDMPDDPNGTQAKAHVEIDAAGAITLIVLDDPGSGYMTAPNVVIRDGTLLDPVANAGSGATATATLRVTSVAVDDPGVGYTSAPVVTIADATGAGSGALATATIATGAISAITVDTPGSGYVAGPGVRKFVDQLPMLCNPAIPGSCSTAPGAKFLPLGVPQEKVYNDPAGNPINSDEYEIGLVQYRTKFNTDIPATLVRGYVQIDTSADAATTGYPLENELLDGTRVPVMIDGLQAYGVTAPQWLGPVLVATKNKPVRIVFRNLLPTGSDGDLFLPTDSTLMGSGMGPMGVADPTDAGTVMDGVRNPVCT